MATAKLAELLAKLGTAEDTPQVRKQLADIVEHVDPIELSLAEQSLIEAGTDPTELRELCKIHLEVLDGKIRQTIETLPEGHMLDTLYKEHVERLRFLDLLDESATQLKAQEAYDTKNPLYARLRSLAEHLVSAEKHHAREEEVLFRELERLGVTGPTRIMRMDHDEFRPKKKRLLWLAENVADVQFQEFRSEFADTAAYIVFHLRDHILKEDSILYPTALDTITDATKWNEMKTLADEIGYCCFSPHH